MSHFRLPSAPRSIQAGQSLATLLSSDAIECLIHNVSLVWPNLDAQTFRHDAHQHLEPLGLMDRGRHLAQVIRKHLPHNYQDDIEILLASMTPVLPVDSETGMEVFFYLPHSCFIAEFGLDSSQNDGNDPFQTSMLAAYELTLRFTSEFCIRPYLQTRTEETLHVLSGWTNDPDARVRRLCSEGTRPRLPWGMRLKHFVENPRLCLPILETLKDDPSLYVRRSVANHLGDIGKDHLQLLLEIVEDWLRDADSNRRWVLRHALRYPDKKGHPQARALRQLAK